MITVSGKMEYVRQQEQLVRCYCRLILDHAILELRLLLLSDAVRCSNCTAETGLDDALDYRHRSSVGIRESPGNFA